MAEITAKLVQELRERTGIGMMDCKKALVDAEGDMDAAIVILRKKMGGKLGSSGERVAGEGVIAVAMVDSQDAAIIELNSETDFVARSEDFKAFATELAQQVIRVKGHSTETVLDTESPMNPGLTLRDRMNDVYAKLRENIVFKRMTFISTDEKGVVAGYVHVPANDKIGVLVELEAATPETAKSEAMQTLARDIAMHIAAARPRYLTRDEVPATILATERDIAESTARAEGKPDAAIAKIIEGRLGKYYGEVVLLDQPYVREPKKTITQVLKEAGEGVTLRRFVRYEVGENVTGVETSGEIKETAE